jgi:hypothetical protein
MGGFVMGKHRGGAPSSYHIAMKAATKERKGGTDSTAVSPLNRVSDHTQN